MATGFSSVKLCDLLRMAGFAVAAQSATLLIRVKSAKCLTHGRRQFVDIVTAFPKECRRVIDDLGKVYRIDAIAREKKLSAMERLLLHQEKSGPVMEGLRRWLTDKFLEREVEPNSGLGRAIRYMLKRWDKLTLFLREPGAPLDNNPCERILKVAIRHRKNSLFYKTEKGAAVGDFFMSLIETCARNGVDAFAYLTALLENVHRVRENPGSWMPWNYRAMLRDGAAMYLREPPEEPVVESWWGWRPMTPDGLPFIGRAPAFDNVFLAAGHGMLGVSMSPATGRLIAELLTGQQPHIDPAPYAVDRGV